MVLRGFKFKLAPTPSHEVKLRQFAGVCRLVYNLALEQRRDFWRQYKRSTGTTISFASQCRELTALRAEFDWIREGHCTAQNQALRDLDRAFSDFFAGNRGFPSPRRKGMHDGFRVKGSETTVRTLNAKWSCVQLPKIGWVKFRSTRPIRGAIRNATISRDPSGWRISFACAIEHEAPTNVCPTIGIDRGVANTLTLSTGEMMSVPASLEAIDRRHRAAQRILSRRKRGSRRRMKQLKRCAALSARRARIRRDWHHKAALSIARRFGAVILEDLKITNMTASAKGTVDAPGRGIRQKAGLNRSILNQGWRSFETILAYKLEERGGHLVKVDPAYTSQTCSECGCIDPGNRKSQAVFRCVECGHEMHADHNAAINILRRNTASMRAEGGRWAPAETRTGGMVIHAENPLASASGRC